MTKEQRKSILKRIFNFKVLFQYIYESFHVILQGKSLSDKAILFLYFLKTPIFFAKSLLQKKTLRQVEEQYKLLPKGITIKNRHGNFYCGKNIMAVYPVAEAYQEHFDKFIDLEEGTFIDVGAHIGKYVIKLGHKLGKKGNVIAIEPEESNFKLLQTNCELNGLNNVTCINKGAFSSTKKLTLYVTPDSGEMYHSIYKKEEGWKEKTIQVDTIDNIVNNQHLTRVDLIKIDTEGAELDVIEGAKETIKKHHPSILVEVWGHESIAKISEILGSFEYDDPLVLDEENFFFKRG